MPVRSPYALAYAATAAACALLAGCGLVVALYVLANFAYVAVLPLDGIQHAP